MACQLPPDRVHVDWRKVGTASTPYWTVGVLGPFFQRIQKSPQGCSDVEIGDKNGELHD